VTVDPSGQFVYVANTISNNVSAFSLNPATGALSPMRGAPFATGSGPVSIAISAILQ
jgi:DNA-binding beta-propeller fold protein YncE